MRIQHRDNPAHWVITFYQLEDIIREEEQFRRELRDRYGNRNNEQAQETVLHM